MYDEGAEARAQREREQRAQTRGERIRTELKARLGDEGAQNATDLRVHMPQCVSLSEVVFQLERLAGEGEAIGEEGGVYQLAGRVA